MAISKSTSVGRAAKDRAVTNAMRNKAAKSPPKQFTSWSFSRWVEWKECPLRASLKHLHKIPEGPKNPAADRGQDIATRTEHWLAKAVSKMPPELAPLEADYKTIRKIPGLKLELQLGFDRNWSPVPWDDWKNCWLRVKMDISYLSKDGKVYTTLDNKTGKFREWENEKYMMQLDLYAAAGAMYYPTAQEVQTQLLYSDLGIKFPPEGPRVYTRGEAEAQVGVWDKRVKPMFADTKFLPRPGEHCRYCPYSRNKSGHCKF